MKGKSFAECPVLTLVHQLFDAPLEEARKRLQSGRDESELLHRPPKQELKSFKCQKIPPKLVGPGSCRAGWSPGRKPKPGKETSVPPVLMRNSLLPDLQSLIAPLSLKASPNPEVKSEECVVGNLGKLGGVGREYL